MVKRSESTNNVQKNEVTFVENVLSADRNDSNKYYFVNRNGKNSKVTYKISTSNKSIFENKLYKEIYDFLDEQEAKLEKKLPYYISVNYLTLEHFRKYIKENGLETFTKNFDNCIFKFMNDITCQNIASNYREVCDYFLNDHSIALIKEFYSNYKVEVRECRRTNRNPIYLFCALNDISFGLCGLNDLLSKLKDDSKSEVQKKYILSVLNNFLSDIRRPDISERSKEDLYYEIVRISDRIDEFTDAIILNPEEKARLYNEITNPNI